MLILIAILAYDYCHNETGSWDAGSGPWGGGPLGEWAPPEKEEWQRRTGPTLVYAILLVTVILKYLYSISITCIR